MGPKSSVPQAARFDSKRSGMNCVLQASASVIMYELVLGLGDGVLDCVQLRGKIEAWLAVLHHNDE